MSISMEDVALKSGVSKATVSRVLNQKRVVQKTREKVIRACEELGYQLNFGIQDFVLKSKNGNCRQLALVMIDEPFDSLPYIHTINSLVMAISKHGYHLSFVNIHSESCVSLYDLPSELRDKRVDGMFVLGHFPEMIAELLLKLGLPAVVIGCFREGVCDGFCNMHADYYSKAKTIIRELQNAGAARIAYVEEIMNLESERQQYRAFVDVHKELLGIDMNEAIHYVGKVKRAGMMDVMTPVFMKRELPFDGIYCPDERIAIEMDKLNFMHSKLFSVPMLPLAVSWLSHNSVLENKVIRNEHCDYGDYSIEVLENMIQKRPFPRKVFL